MSRSLAQLEPDSLWFPNPHSALSEPSGLLAIGGDLAPERLLQAYHNGIFPWYGAHQPILWWSPDPRGVLQPNHLHISRSLQKRIRKHDVTVWINRNFMDVVAACAAPRRDSYDTWIHDALMASYAQLHAAGHAHSVEVWQQDRLIGGLYGISVGRLFCGESMFSRQADASKLALVALCQHFNHCGGELIDCQMQTEHLLSLGAEEWPRPRFIQRLHQLRTLSVTPDCWTCQQVTL
jgi:leucyl/phenylalanyl-tRNA---protein transferase